MQNTFDNLILAIVWPIGSGKWTASGFLERRYGARIFKCSGPLREILQTLDIEVSREKMQLLSRVLRENFGQDIIARVAKKRITISPARISLIDGARRLEDISPFQNLPNFFLIYVDADVQTRYERIVRRAENGGDSEKSFETFLLEEKGEAESRTHMLKDLASVVLDNSAGEAEFNELLDAFISGLLK